MEIYLTRFLKQTENKLVKGVLTFGLENEIVIIRTKENLLHLAPEGKYLMRYEYSPKFKRNLWELYGISKRSEIKFHMGSIAEHSRGCILLGDDDLTRLHTSLDSEQDYTIKIKNK